MKYSYNWLQELSGTSKNPEELADFLTMRAFEVESITEIGFDNAGIVIGEVIELEKHPNADRLRVAKITLGEEVLQIVCGAPNIKIGQKVPVALVDAKLPGNVEIKQNEIRGVMSYGMVCSQKELGLGDSHDGIMVLSKKAPVGVLLKDFLNDIDYIFDIKVLPDRAHDAMSHVGMAREIVALEGGELDYDYESLRLTPTKTTDFSIGISDEAMSARYSGVLLHNIEVKSSPAWLKNRLIKLGIRPINNVVDVTNFVMLELGQPLHAFDWDTLATQEDGTKSIIVRGAQDGETLQLLDEKTYALQPEDIVVADHQKALALGGVMGGLASSITEKTTAIFLEGAHFNAVSIRKTRTRLGIRTDASDRFEKDLDPNLVEKSIVRAIELLAHLTTSDAPVIQDVYAHIIHPKTITLNVTSVQRLLGVAVSSADIASLLPRLGFQVKVISSDVVEIVIPTYRIDVVSAQDIMEEVGKMIGYASVVATAPVVPLIGVAPDTKRLLERKLQDGAVANGFIEMLSYAFYSKKDAAAAGMSDVSYLELANPMNPDQALMRASLLPGMLGHIRENLKHQKSIQLFELGNVYYSSEFQDVHESKIFAMALTVDKNDTDPFFTLKGTIERLLQGFGIVSSYDTSEGVGQYWHPTRTGDIFGINGREAVHIGRIGEIHPFVLEYFQIKKRVAYCEIDCASLEPLTTRARSFSPLRRYPEVLRDISLFVPHAIRVKDIIDGIAKKSQGKVLGVELFDQYIDEATQMKSLAFHIHFGDADKTLEGAEVDTLLEKIAASLERELQVQRRA